MRLSTTGCHLVAMGTLSKCKDSKSDAGGTVSAGGAIQAKNNPDE